MLALYLSPIYILVNLYILRWLLKWMHACSRRFKKKWVRIIVISTYIFFSTSMLTGFLLPKTELQRILKLIGNYWLGVMLYTILTVSIVDFIRFILGKIKKINQKKLHSTRTFVTVGSLCITVIIVLSMWGVVNARSIHTTDYQIQVKKSADNLKELTIVLAADFHLGYNVGTAQMQQMVDAITIQEPDLVVFAGDIFDNEYEALDNPEALISILRGIQSTYGVYACYGNHDIEEKILAGFTFRKQGEKKVSDERMDAFLAKADIRLLQDEGIYIDNAFHLYGRADFERPGRGIKVRKTPEEITADLDMTKPVIVLDHEPRELSALSNAGVDIDLSGHTHDGQMFPGNLTINLLWENACGYLKKGDMHNIVTSGVGVFGPNMRIGTKAEICRIQVQFIN